MQTLDNRAASTRTNAAGLPRQAPCSLGIASRSRATHASARKSVRTVYEEGIMTRS